MVVENVLRTAVMDKGELKLEIVDINVNEVVDQVLQNMKIQLEQKGGSFITDCKRQIRLFRLIKSTLRMWFSTWWIMR